MQENTYALMVNPISVALELSYGMASSFIAMFRRLLDTTLDEYRRNRG